MRRLVLVALLVSLIPAAPAAADSIAYVQGGDVWLATPDGARRVQVTHTGTYAAVSQADDGTMVALAPGERLHRLTRDGRVTADFLTPISDGASQAGPVNRFHGPFNPRISPDGTKVAYEWFNDSYDNDTGCSDTTVPPCYVYSQRQGVGISHADRYTGPEEFGLMTGWIYPSWIVRRHAAALVLGRGDERRRRVHPRRSRPRRLPARPVVLRRQPGLRRRRRRAVGRQTLVGIAGQSDEKLRVYRTTMSPFGAPNWDHQPFAQGNQPVAQQCYELPGKFESTSLAPSGRAMAYGTAEGVWVAAIPEGCAPGDAGALVFARRDLARLGSGRRPGRDRRGADPTTPAGPAAAKLRLSRRGGLTATLTTGATGRATFTAVLKRRTIAKRTVKVNGRATVRFKLKRRGLVTVKATFKPTAGGAPQTVSAKLRLR